MATTLAIAAMKGGVGKTTVTMQLAGYLAKAQNRVLIIDHDPQGSASMNCLKKSMSAQLPGDRTISALFDKSCAATPEDVIHKSHLENIWIVPANVLFADHLETRPLDKPVGEQRITRDFVQQVSDRFHWVLLDTPATFINLAGWNCIVAADYLVTPVLMKGYSMQTVAGIEEVVTDALEFGNGNLRFLGYIINGFDNRTKDKHRDSVHKIRAKYNQQVFDTELLLLEDIDNAESENEHVFSYAPKSKAAKLVTQLAEELVARIEKTKARRAA